MKKVKRILMLLTICSLSIIAVSCSSKNEKDNKNTTTTDNKDNKDNTKKEDKKEDNTKKEEEKGTKVDSAPFLQKYTEAIKTVKSSKAVVEKKETINNNNGESVSVVTMNMAMSNNPTIIKNDWTKVTIEGEKIENQQYITDDVIYNQHYQTKDWTKSTFEAVRKIFDGRRDIVNHKNALEFLTTVKDNLTVVQKSSTYEVTYSGSDENLGKLVTKVISLVDRGTDKYFKEVKFNNLQYKFIVDAKTFLPIEFYVKTRYDYYENEKKVDGIYMDEELTVKYSDVNKVEAIKIPENIIKEAK